MKVSSLTKEELPELWAVMQEFHQTMLKTGELFETRKKQQRVWMWNYITQHIMEVLNQPSVSGRLLTLNFALGFPPRPASQASNSRNGSECRTGPNDCWPSCWNSPSQFRPRHRFVIINPLMYSWYISQLIDCYFVIVYLLIFISSLLFIPFALMTTFHDFVTTNKFIKNVTFARNCTQSRS